MPILPKNVRQHRNRYEFRAKVDDELIVHNLGTDLSKARKLAEQYALEVTALRLEAQAKYIRRPRRIKQPMVTVAEWSEQWLRDYVPRHRVERDHKLARRRIEQYILPILGGLPLSKVRRADLEELVLSLEAKPLKQNTRQHILSDARCMFGHAVELEVIDFSPFAGKKILPGIVRGRPNPLLSTEVDTIRRICGEPYLSAIDLALGTGLRWGEQRALQWRHIDFERAELTVEKSKSGRPRQVPLGGQELIILRRWRDETESVFVMPWRPVGANWPPRLTRRKTDPPLKWKWHQLRHTFACRYLENDGSIAALQRLLGHSSITTTEIYAEVHQAWVKADFRRVEAKKLAQVGPLSP